MSARDDRYTDIDQNIAANLRTYREADNISQDELAQRMADRGFGFSQATVWKIESGQRPVRASELIALAGRPLVHPSPDPVELAVPVQRGAGRAHLVTGDPVSGQFDDLVEAEGPVSFGVYAQDETDDTVAGAALAAGGGAGGAGGVPG